MNALVPHTVAHAKAAGPDVYAVLHHPRLLSARSGLIPLAEAVGAKQLRYRIAWEQVQARSWTLGSWLRQFGNRYYGSEWNALIPFRDERRFLRAIPRRGAKIVHFLWAEFARPKHATSYHKRGAVLVGTFHASRRKQPSVLTDPASLRVFDWITLMSETQKTFFVEGGFPESRIRVILHGVDTEFYSPMPQTLPQGRGPLRGLLVGKTERDHGFMADVLRRVPAGVLDLAVCTTAEQAELNYCGVPNVRLLPRLSDDALRNEYRSADLLIMPMLDCAANNVVLEAMACGTPVLANRVGGLPEYIGTSGGFLLDGKDPDEWAQRIGELAASRERLLEMRGAVRSWALGFDWKVIAQQFDALYQDALNAARSQR